MSSDDGHDDDGAGDSIETTIVRRGKEAFLLAEMARFSRELIERPLQKLIEDLPGLLELPESKYPIVAMTLKRRMRTSDIERDAIAAELASLLQRAPEAVRDRCQALLNVV